MRPQVVVVGASLAGLRAAEQLRAQGYAGDLTIVGAEKHKPYNRPPLSKEALSGHGPDVTVEALSASLAFRPKSSIADVRWQLGSPAVSSDLAEGLLSLANGQVLAFDALVVATGLRPRRLLGDTPTRGRHVVRTVDDAVSLRAALVPAVRAVVVGGGFIGSEVASTLTSLGARVTVVEPLPVPMLRGVGAELGAALRAHHEHTGLQVITGQGVSRLIGATEDAEQVAAVVLDDGTELAADLVIESIGSHTNTEWLQGNGLDLTDGVLCDNQLRVEGRAEIVAAGDIARFPNPRFDDIARRVEHWNMPGETAKRAAVTLADHLSGHATTTDPFTPLPAFWSDQFGLRLQSFGSPGLADTAVVEHGALDDLDGGLVMAYLRKDQLVGAVLVNVPASEYRRYRDAVAPLPLAV